MTTLVESIGRRNRASSTTLPHVIAIVVGSLTIALFAQISLRLPFTPVPVTGQTLAVLLVGSSLGSRRGLASVLLYLAEGAVGLPFFAAGSHGIDLLRLSSATGGYLWGFAVAALVLGFLAERGWDRSVRSAIGAMLIGEIIIYSFGVPWLGHALGLTAQRALQDGLYPFVLADVAKLLLAAGCLPALWKVLGRDTRRSSYLSMR
ncbi:MAG: biotin transport system substrate-specific component [Actinomycetota bacterium]|nr:biotin transport system substrate-specific component [Actinomycetota bacterium]